MKIAIIDLGTNTFNLLIADISAAPHYKILFDTKTPVNLGKDGILKKTISSDAFERGINALRNYVETIEKYNVSKKIAIATSAVRNANNGKDFVKKIKQLFDLNIQIIDGNKEAELIYYGVKLALDLGSKPLLIMDIGGGSIEFIIADATKIFWKKSFDIGVSRLLEKFKPSDPISIKEIKLIEEYFSSQLNELFEVIKTYPVSTLVGSSGSFDTLAELIAHRFYTPEIIENKTEYSYDLYDYFHIHLQLLKSTKQERLNFKGMFAMRVDMIVIATIAIYFILEKCNIKNMRLSTFALKEGVLWKELYASPPDPLSKREGEE